MDDGIGILVGALIGGAMGFWCSMIPSKAAMARNQTTFATVSIVICVLAGMLAGCLLALPLAFILKLIVVAMGEKQIPMHSSGVALDDYDAIRRGVRRDGFVPDPLQTRAPYTVVGPVIICNECRKACSKVNGQAPDTCPNCHETFNVIPVVRKAKPKPKPARMEGDEDLVDLKRV